MKVIVRTGSIAASLQWIACVPAIALAQTAPDIRDIRGPKTLRAAWILPAMLAGIVLVAAGVYLFWRWRRRTIRQRAPTLSERTLARLEASRLLMVPATAREFAITASEAIRQYIEQRFQVIATQRTTEEFLQSLLHNSNDALARHRALLAEFLQQCDLVKFGGTSLQVADMESLLRSARNFVLETGEAPAP